MRSKNGILGETEKNPGNTLEKVYEKEERKAQKELAASLKFPFVNLSLAPINRETLTLIPEEKARDAQLVTFSKKGETIHVGIVNPKKKESQALLGWLKERGFDYKVFVVTKTALEKVFLRYPAARKQSPRIQGTVSVNHDLIERIQRTTRTLDQLKERVSKDEEDATSEILETILAGALAFSASDIHIEAEAGRSKIRYRVDGMLNDITFLRHEVHDLLISRIKILSRLLLNVHDTAQDGHFTIRSGGEEIEIRVSIIPSEYKEAVVLRVLNPRLLLSIHELGLREDLERIILEKVRAPYGMILVTGPTGSGKTTTLYAFIEDIKKPEINIITIEDPIENRV